MYVVVIHVCPAEHRRATDRMAHQMTEHFKAAFCPGLRSNASICSLLHFHRLETDQMFDLIDKASSTVISFLFFFTALSFVAPSITHDALVIVSPKALKSSISRYGLTGLSV